MKRNQWACLILFSLLLFFPFVSLFADTAVIPGDISSVCYYSDFFYNHPSEDFCYYLNDRLLFTEKPDEKIIAGGIRTKLLKIVRWHDLIKKSLRRLKRDKTGMVSLSLMKPDGFDKARVIMNLLGLSLEKTESGHFLVFRNPSPGFSDYYRFAHIDLGALTRRLNKTHRFDFQFKESDIPIPWDYESLREITGLNLSPANFFETMLKNERFSLLLGTLCRLSKREIRRIGNLQGSSGSRINHGYGAWKEIYRDQKFLMGMFMLSHGLRVNREGQWELPGGTAAEPFWIRMAGEDCKLDSLTFLRSLALKDEGKLNYLFVFSAFLAPETQKILFTGAGEEKMRLVYRDLWLADKEELREDRFPRFRESNFFTLLYALHTENGRFLFQPPVETWIRIVKRNRLSQGDIFDLLSLLLTLSRDNKNGIDDIQTFTAIYTKFRTRPELLTERVLAELYHNYAEYNVLVDYIERLPLKKPAAVVELFSWVNRLKLFSKKDRLLYTALFQSLFEILAHASLYAPDRYDYDSLIETLIDICNDPQDTYDKLFLFFRERLGVAPGGKALVNFVIQGIDNREMNVDDTDYRFMAKGIYRDIIEKILRTQGVCPMQEFYHINRLLEQLTAEADRGGSVAKIAQRLDEAFQELPYGEISSDAPRYIRERVKLYNRHHLIDDLSTLVEMSTSDDSLNIEEVKRIAVQLKKDYLLPQLKHYLLSLAYAINAKSSELRVFLNSNLVRLHDFDDGKGRTPWNYSGSPHVAEYFSEYHFCGGLSRLNLSMASKWQDHLCRRTYIHNPQHVQAVVLNMLDFFPTPLISQSVTYNALLVDFGMELLREGRDNESLKEDLLKELGTITSGYHYRKVADYLFRRSTSHDLFFSEIKRVGEAFLVKRKYLEISGYGERLLPYTHSPLDRIIEKEEPRFGGIFYHTFGSLTTQRFRMFPQDVANFFSPGWVSGEMVDEFKVKLAWDLYRKRIPSYLLGQVLYRYFNKAAPWFLNQNHIHDYYSTYFLFEVFNPTQLKYIVKNLQKEGHLRLK